MDDVIKARRIKSLKFGRGLVIFGFIDDLFIIPMISYSTFNMFREGRIGWGISGVFVILVCVFFTLVSVVLFRKIKEMLATL